MTNLIYQRDDEQRRIVVTMIGSADASHFLSVIERQRREGTWHYGLLYDLRRLTTPLLIPEQRGFLTHIAATPETAAGRGPVAFVAVAPAVYASSCLYATLARAECTMAVFREMADAYAWLTSQAPDMVSRPPLSYP